MSDPDGRQLLARPWLPRFSWERLHAALNVVLPPSLDLCSDSGLCALLGVRLDRATTAAALLGLVTFALAAVCVRRPRDQALHARHAPPRSSERCPRGGWWCALACGLWLGLLLAGLEPPPPPPYELGPYRLGPRLVLSPRLSAAAPTRWVVLTTTHHAHRAFTCGVVAHHWATFLQYRPYVVVVGANKTLDTTRLAALRALTVAVGGHFAHLDFGSDDLTGVCSDGGFAADGARRRGRRCLPWPYLAQTARIYAAALPGIGDLDEIVTADADLLPLVTKPFHVAPSPRAAFVRISHYAPGQHKEGNCTGRLCLAGTDGARYHFDMCYVRGSRLAWRDAFFGAAPVRWSVMLEAMARYHFDEARGGREQWFGDQMLLTRVLLAWNASSSAQGRGIDTLYLGAGEVAARPGWWDARHVYDAARGAVAPIALRQIRERGVFELHKLSFVHDEPASSARNRVAIFQVLAAAMDSLDSDGGGKRQRPPPVALSDFFAAWPDAGLVSSTNQST